MKTTDCLPTDVLRQIINNTLSGERQVECTQHLDGCEYCQAKLEELATEGTNLSQVVQHLNHAEPVATSAYWPALKSVSAEPPHSVMTPALGTQTPPPPGYTPADYHPPGYTPASSAAAAATPPDSPPASVKTPASGRTRDLSLHFLQPPADPAYLGRIGHFEVMRILGRGGMGIVFEAFDSRLQRNVALKVLDPELADDETARLRFCREARAAASISHENVVAVHQVEKSEGGSLPYLVMQLIAGETLEDRLDRGEKLPLREIVRIAMQAAQGLAAAHAQGLIHRDIKPGNILLEAPQRSRQAHRLSAWPASPRMCDSRAPASCQGTPLYMAPEQALGEESDHRADLFSLGAIMYEMCAGKPPFTGNSALVILKQIAEAKPKPVREVNPQVPDWLAYTIDRLLAKKPADRIQTAAHLAELLEFQWALMKTSSEDLPTVCQIEERKRARRNLVIGVAVGATFLLLGLLGGPLFGQPRCCPGRCAPTATVSSAEPIAVLNVGGGAMWSVSIDSPSGTMAVAVEDGTGAGCGISPAAASRPRSTPITASPGPPAFRTMASCLATAGDDSLIKLWQPAEAEPLKTFQHPAAVRRVAFSRDDQTLFAGDREGNLRPWSIETGKPLVEAKQPGTMYAIALSPNDETLATAASDKIVRLWNSKTLTQKLPLEGHTGPVYGLAFNTDGSRLASSSWDKTVRIWDTNSGQVIKVLEAHDGDVWTVAYSPDGKKLATGGWDGAVKIWDAESGSLLATFLGHKSAVHSVAFDQDGKQLASVGRDGSGAASGRSIDRRRSVRGHAFSPPRPFSATERFMNNTMTVSTRTARPPNQKTSK